MPEASRHQDIPQPTTSGDPSHFSHLSLNIIHELLAPYVDGGIGTQGLRSTYPGRAMFRYHVAS
jgi:hypothetical protein